MANIITSSVAATVQDRLRREQNRPLVVSVMGQSGVGKSSLVNVLFNTDLPTDAVRPCTKQIQCVTHKNPSGGELHFYDLPGIGERETDGAYLATYREMLLASDIVLWAFHADSRSVGYDRTALLTILTGFDRQTQIRLANKITCVLTKADLLAPPAWTLAIVEPGQGMFVPPEQTEVLLEQKARYIWETLFADYSAQHHTKPHSVIPCSSRFHYNLDRLMAVILEQLENDAVVRFGQFFRHDVMSYISLDEAKACCNLILFDQSARSIVFDLRKTGL